VKFLIIYLFLFLSRAENREDSDNEDWQARDESRTHSVKFSEDSATDKETPFVRQNTPHPKELKLKAHKLFSKDKKGEDENLHPLSEEVSICRVVWSHKEMALRLSFDFYNNGFCNFFHSFSSFQSQRTDFSESTRENSREFNAYQEVSTTITHTENQHIITSPNSDVSFYSY
jgi:hypothetical protein